MSADGCPYATRQRLALECALFEPFQKFVFNETPQPTFAFSKRVSRNVAQTCPPHEGPAVHLDKSGGLFRIQDANSASIGICAWRQNGAISRILLNRRSFHRCTPGLPGRDRKIMFPAWITFLVLVQSKDNTGVFPVVMTGFYVLLQEASPLAQQESISIKSLGGVPWILFAPQVHPFLYEQLTQRADVIGVVPRERHHVTNAEHAAQLVNRTGGVAFLTRYGASRVASDGLTLRPLVEPDLRLRIVMVARNDAVGVVSEFVRATVKRVKKLTEPTQRRLPLAI